MATPQYPFWRPKSYGDNKYAYVMFNEPYTLMELRYMDVLSQVLAKPQWWVKLHDPAIVAKWKAESTLSDDGFAFLEHELNVIANGAPWTDAGPSTPSSPRIIPLPAHGVFMSDSLVAPDLLRSIQVAAVKLEEEARGRGDFHPHSNDQVLDIVHPSLYCAVNGRTRLSTSTAATVGDQVLAWPKSAVYDVSNKFQWLPTPVAVDAAGSASFQAYINNIHPTDHAALYTSLESLLTTMLPLFEKCLGAADTQPVHRIADIDMDQVMPVNKTECARKTFHALKREDNPDITDDDLDALDDEFDEFREKFDDKNVPLFLPTFPAVPSEFAPAFQSVNLKDQTLQVIVKIASIELTPDKPKYPGGSWHVEGMTNESIAATGILYYDCDNITPSKLAFRLVYEPTYDFAYEQGEHTAVQALYGITSEGCDNTQVVGSVQAATGRCVVFPNFMQHCVAPFELTDPTKNGHRKIVCFFLINPKHSILSTANVPPQQEEWALRFQKASMDLPQEAPPGTMTHAQAREIMLELMDERKNSSVFAEFMTEGVSLCEH